MTNIRKTKFENHHGLWFVVVLCLFASIAPLQGQEYNPYKNVTLPSPTAIQYQKFIDAPVGMYTGTPVTNIPLYTVNAGEIVVPISLMHHGSGVKLNEHASWVGAGWSLNAGGLITRSVNGLPDFEVFIDDLSESFVANSDGNENQPQNGQTAQMVTAYYDSYEVSEFAGLSTSLKKAYLEGVLGSERDAQPDVYYFFFPGFSGKFFVDQDGTVLTNPNDKIKISKPTNVSQHWVITDSNGTKYTFGSTTNSKEYSIGFKSVDYVSSWYLDKIETVSENEVNFNYSVAGSFTTVPTLHTYDYQAQYTRTSGGGASTTTVTYAKDNQFKPVKLTSITFDGNTGSGTVNFTSSQNRNDSYQSGSYLAHYKLNEIKVLNGSSQAVYRFDLDYDNLSNNLWLNSVTKHYYNDAGTSVLATDKAHEFTYFNHTSLPSSRSYSIDYWGYYNAQSNGSSLLPRVAYGKTGTSRSYGSGAYRTANSTYAQYGSLTRIDYPLGAFTEFEYELNTFTGFSGQGAGLRVKKVTVADGLGSPAMITAYQYIDPANGGAATGKLQAPMFTDASVTQHYVFNNYSNANVRTTHPLNLAGHQGVGYSAVVELQGASGENGRNVYYFENDYPSLISQTTASGYQNQMLPVPFYFNDNLNGKLEKVQIQKKSGGTYSTLSQTEYQYTLNNEALKTKGLIANAYIGTMQNGGIDGTNIFVFPSGSWTDFTGYLTYQIETDWLHLNQSIARNYEGGSYNTVTTDYTYHSQSARELKNYVSKSKATYPDGRAIETDYTYVFNNGSGVYATMNANHQQAVLTEHTYWKEGSTYHHMGGSQRVFASITSQADNSSSTVTRPLMTELYEVRSESNTSAGFSTRLVRKINSYNYYGRVIEQEDANGIATTNIWYENTLLATAHNARANEVNYESYEYGLTPGEVSNPSVAFTGAKYGTTLAGGVATTANKWLTYWRRPGGTWTYYKVNYTGQVFTSGGPYDDMRIFPKDAQMVTYSYKPLIGASSQSDNNNRPTFYVYDDRNRVEALLDHYGNVIKAFKQINPSN